MIYLQKHGLKMARISLGTAGFGSAVSREQSFALMDRYYEAGGNLLDTARVYADWLPNGHGASERTVGEWVASRGLRDRVLISTKGAHPPMGNLHAPRVRREAIEQDIHESLRCLGTDYVDIYFLHRDDESRPVSEIMPVLDRLVRAGKARLLGASNWTAQRIAEANAFARENGLAPFAFSQIMYSYAEINAEKFEDDTQVIMNETEYAAYLESDLTLMAFSSQGQGFFSRAAEQGIENLSPSYRAKFDNKANRVRLARLTRLAEKTGVTPTALGLLPLIHNTDLDTLPIIGPTRLETLDASLTALDCPEQFLSELLI
ncbi:MAG: aldo/keto reductase [Clostridia bacterium]|nr:aldo/keto reductase [Clostridia bacterium]